VSARGEGPRARAGGGRTVDAIVLDIEGTMSPVSFVYDVLFPFARQNLRAFLDSRRSSPEVIEAIDRLRQDWEAEAADRSNPPPLSAGSDPTLESIAVFAEWLMDRDRKSPGLKLLQGHIWEDGFRSGAFVADVFDDVLPAVREWRADGLKVAIYSSGSVKAQRLLFGHTRHGDVTALFDAFFDTGVGPKTSAASYRAIAERLGCAPHRVLFVSDAPREIEAAAEADCRVVLCVRPGNPHQFTSPSIPQVRRFDEIAVRA